jgi:DNA polymerase-4/DNA polymerase V
MAKWLVSSVSLASHTSNWYNAIAHVDADCFFASCELTRRPGLRGKPLCVLSSQDACVVAKTYDAKDAGIKTGMPVWEARRLLPQATYLSADFRFYGLISAKMFAILREYSPEIEVYSIDEAFMDMNGIRILWRKSFRQLADDMRERIYRDIGITVSVGISTTRTLAKIASEKNKPNGSTIVPGRSIRHFLATISVGDVPGIGRSRAALLHKFSIHTALDYCSTDKAHIHRMLGKTGTDLWDELNGKPVFKLELQAPRPKSIARTASLGCVTTERTLIASHLSYHTTRVVTELVRQQLTASMLTVFLRLKSFEAVVCKVRMQPCNDFGKLNKAVKSSFKKLFKQGYEYRACGVIASKLNADAGQGDLFIKQEDTGRQLRLIKTMDAINSKYGSQTLRPAQSIQKPRRSTRFNYPVITAS